MSVSDQYNVEEVVQTNATVSIGIDGLEQVLEPHIAASLMVRRKEHMRMVRFAASEKKEVRQ